MSTYIFYLVDIAFYYRFQPLAGREQFIVFLHHAVDALRAKRFHDAHDNVIEGRQAKVGEHSLQGMGVVEGPVDVAGAQSVAQRKKSLVVGDALKAVPL